MPDVTLPGYREGYPEDAEIHVRRAVESHIARFGSAPRGMWPSEGSVCQALIPLLARHGIEWIATDEEILSCSTGGKVGRDSRGYVRHPELLYRAWKVREGDHELSIVFRDHSMSDQVGFHYQRSPGPVAAGDFLGKLHAIGDACRHNPATLVSVILDGENCWEYYPDGGVSFLRSLYQGRGPGPSHPAGQGRRVPPRASAPGHACTGSSPEAGSATTSPSGSATPKTTAAGTRCTPPGSSWSRRNGRAATIPPALARAWEEIYIAEGSDWFWWYGDDHSSPQDALFDHLFRKHLRNVYTLLGCDPPGCLFTPISQAGSHRPINDQPTSFLNVKIDGRATYFEWIDAARYFCGNDRGTMTLVTKGLLHCLWFGFDADAVPAAGRHRGRAGRGTAG